MGFYRTQQKSRHLELKLIDFSKMNQSFSFHSSWIEKSFQPFSWATAFNMGEKLNIGSKIIMKSVWELKSIPQK